VDGIIVEDDYDGEFRYDVAPMPALRSLRGGGARVVYVGTASRLWAPTLRVAWVVAPPAIRAPLSSSRAAVCTCPRSPAAL
jgi:GntR family transcriptional regulator/MocR family aminotransferase